MSNNQQGAIHATTALLAVAVLSVISFSAYRIGVSNNDTNNQEQSETSAIDLVDGIKVIEPEKDTAKEVTIPKDETPADTAPIKEDSVAPAPKPETKQEQKETTTEKKKDDKVWLQMTSVSAEQDGSVVNISSRLPQALSGTCHFKLWQDGYERVYSNTQISNSTDCAGQINVANMVTYDGWELHVWFDGDDGKTHAYQEDMDFPLTDPS